MIPLPQHIATIHDDGYWTTNVLGPIGYNHTPAGWPSQAVYTAKQMEECAAAVLAAAAKAAEQYLLTQYGAHYGIADVILKSNTFIYHPVNVDSA